MIKKSSSLPNHIEKNKNQNKLKPMVFFISFVLISGLIAFLIGGFIIGNNQAKQNESILLNE